jgi:LysM repeat protein
MVKEREEVSERQPWVARVLAPLAFFAAVAILVLLVNSSLTAETDGDSASPPPPPAATGSETTGAGTTTTVPRAQRRYYRIQSGDTLEALAERFDTTVDDLLSLNPGIDANSLTPGQRIRIR